MRRNEKQTLSCDGLWEFRAGEEGDWLKIAAPGCWETLGISRDWEGPGYYRARVRLPEDWKTGLETRYWLRFGGVSYACTVQVNGVEVGEHRGAWDAFDFDVTEAVGQSREVEIRARVVKPGGETYPAKRATAGFLPYVCGYLFGGIWQSVTLECRPAEKIPAKENVEIAPAKTRLTVEGNTILFDGKPIYPRLALSWGWYPETGHCNPPREILLEEFTKLKALGYNGIKCCLWVPPQAYLDLCDEMGLLVWLELPLWLPEMTEADLARVYEEYGRIVRQARHHPCIILWTLGCELSASCPDEFLSRLYEEVKRLTGSPLVRDNSGGGECYGGLLQEYADFYDYHFYCDLPFLRSTFDYFLPRWRPAQPWLFGEFCDADAFRDIAALREANGGAPPWWASDDPQINPPGARWDMNIIQQWKRMEANGLFARSAELKEGQRRQTLLHRKFTIELARSYREMSGYVITGLRDTPIATAGMFDDFGDFRFFPAEFTRFNADTVLLLGWHRRRDWRDGGDRPSYVDHWTHWAGETLLPRIGISHYGPDDAIVRAEWELVNRQDAENARKGKIESEESELKAGSVRQVGLFSFIAPDVAAMTKFELRVTARLASGSVIENVWPLWFAPKPDWERLIPWTSYDPAGRLRGLRPQGAVYGSCDREAIGAVKEGTLLVATRWTPEIADFARRGGQAFVFLEQGDGMEAINDLPLVGCPFWREAMKLFEPHTLWERFPQEGFTDIHFYGLGPDCALLPVSLENSLPDAEWRPILRRVDARTYDVTDYLTEATFPGGGRLLLTTLRPDGGLGDQPDGLLRHTTGVCFLAAALDYLREARSTSSSA